MTALAEDVADVADRDRKLAAHVAAVVASAPAPSDEVVARLRRLLPPVDAPHGTGPV